ncbi:MAG TPA: VanZ family protein [Pirellulaceae bacterium]|nr:VanZ family protein [Pirellulaceae bacterium]
MPSRPRALLIVVLAALYLALMFAATHWPARPGGTGMGLDKLVHAGMYAGLAMLILAATGLLRPVTWKVAIAVVLGVALYGAIDEWTQSFVPHRTADFRDWVADVVGAAAGAAFYMAVSRRSRAANHNR